MEISGGPGSLETAAIVAALAQLEEEYAAAAAVPPGRPVPGRWVLSGRPRPLTPPFTARPSPETEGWSAEGESL